MKKISTTVKHAVIACALVIGVSNHVWAQGAKKELLVGPQAVIWCGDLTPTPWEVADQIQEGFVIFNHNDADETGKLMATVKLKGAEPSTSYPVRLIQNGNNGCWTVDGTLTTNHVGNGVLHLEEPSVGDAAQVIIDTGSLFATPAWRGTDIFYY
jgi:hypothetical protein